jgi:TonB family protein
LGTQSPNPMLNEAKEINMECRQQQTKPTKQENRFMRIVFPYFVLSIVFHLAIFNWLIHYKISVKQVYKEKIINVVPISKDELILPWESKHLKAPSVKRVSPFIPGAPTGKGVQPVQTAAKEIETPVEDVVTNVLPPKDAPPSFTPSLSLNSPNMRKILDDVSRQAQTTRRFNSNVPLTGAAASVFIGNYDLKPWTKSALLVIQKNWTIPLLTPKKPGCPVEISTVIEKDGKISSLKIKKTSNVEILDRAALSALSMSSPLPPLPDDFPYKSVEASFMFNYEWR